MNSRWLSLRRLSINLMGLGVLALASVYTWSPAYKVLRIVFPSRYVLDLSREAILGFASLLIGSILFLISQWARHREASEESPTA
jgi:hypothetical protein